MGLSFSNQLSIKKPNRYVVKTLLNTSLISLRKEKRKKNLAYFLPLPINFLAVNHHPRRPAPITGKLTPAAVAVIPTLDRRPELLPAAVAYAATHSTLTVGVFFV